MIYYIWIGIVSSDRTDRSSKHYDGWLTKDMIIRMMPMIMILMMTARMSVVKIMVFGGNPWPVGDSPCLPLSFSDNPLQHDLSSWLWGWRQWRWWCHWWCWCWWWWTTKSLTDDDDGDGGTGVDLSGAVSAGHSPSPPTLVASLHHPRVRHRHHSHLKHICHFDITSACNWDYL